MNSCGSFTNGGGTAPQAAEAGGGHKDGNFTPNMLDDSDAAAVAMLR